MIRPLLVISIIALVLILRWHPEQALAQQEPLHSNSQVDLNPDLGAPAGPPVPFKIVCYQHGITPYAIVDQTGNTLFKIECP